MSEFEFPNDEVSDLQESGTVDEVCRTCPVTELEIAMFFDGTGNNLANVKEGDQIRAADGFPEEGSYNNDYSNVAKLYNIYEPLAVDVRNKGGGVGKIRRAEIIDGIGTTSGQEDSTIGNALGWGQSGVEARVQDGFLLFLSHVNEAKARGEVKTIKLDVFGFSRGSAAARHFVNCVRRGHAGHGYGGPAYEVQKEDKPKIEVRFLGLFDTVVSWGLKANDNNHGPLKIALPDDIATKIVHITALDEFRENFPLTEAPDSAETIRMPGAHSDIGGGYPEFWKERVEIKKAKYVVENFNPRPGETTSVQMYPNLSPEDEALRLQLISEGWIYPDDTEALIREYIPSIDPNLYTYKWFLSRPWLNHRLSHVALHVMHKKAIDAGVPFPSLPNDDNHAIQDKKLLGLKYALLSGAAKYSDRSSVAYRRNYVHHSAHWTPSGPFHPMKPHEGKARRTVYKNDGSKDKS